MDSIIIPKYGCKCSLVRPARIFCLCNVTEKQCVKALPSLIHNLYTS